MKGYLRADGRKGIRNTVAVAYLVECARFVSDEIARAEGADLIGFPGCFPNHYAQDIMEKLCTHPNIGAVLLVSLGCESFNRYKLEKVIAESGRAVKTLVIQKTGGTKATIEAGRAFVKSAKIEIADVPLVDMGVDELVVGTVCGGSDGTSGITGNPAVGRTFDLLVEHGAVCIFEETGELIGCEDIMASRAKTPELANILRESVDKAARYYATLG